MLSQPLSYEGLKCVLQYMEVDKRLLVSRKCPSVRTAERAVPLKVNSLEFSKGVIKLNKTTYRVGIYQHYLTGPTPPAIERKNRNGGVQFEIDRFGIEIEDDKFVVTSGDVQMGGKQVKDNRTDEEAIRYLKTRTQYYENEIRRNRLLKQLYENYSAELIAYQNRRDNVNTPQDHFVQLTVASENEGSRYIERYHHNKKYSEAVKQLATLVFGKRRWPIYCNRFSVYCNIVRLPIGVQFQIANLSFVQSAATGLEALIPIIHESSFPLKNFKNGRLTLADLTTPIIRDSASLTISTIRPEPTLTLLLLKNATNKRVTLSPITPVSSGLLSAFIENWVQEGRPIGTHFTFVFMKKDVIVQRLSAIRNQFNAEVLDRKEIIIPMAEARQLIVFFVEQPFQQVEGSLWRMHMIVKPVEQK